MHSTRSLVRTSRGCSTQGSGASSPGATAPTAGRVLVLRGGRWFHGRAMGCLCCGAAVDVGLLCRACAQAVAPCDGLIPDHVRSTVRMTDADAWLVDGFGTAHAIAAK